MDYSSASSSDSSDNELDEDTQRSVTNLSNLLLHKLKNDGIISQLTSPQKEEEEERPARKKHVAYEISSRNRYSTADSKAGEVKTGNQVIASMKPTTAADYNKKRAEEALKHSRANPVTEREEERKRESRKEKKMRKKGERSSWTSKGWGTMKPKENPTDEEKMDLMLLKMRSTVDPKRHYKHTDVKMPKYFQVGTIIDSPADFHHRLPSKRRKQTMVEELLADAEFRKQTKKRYLEVMETKRKRSAVYHSRPPRPVKVKKKARDEKAKKKSRK